MLGQSDPIDFHSKPLHKRNTLDYINNPYGACVFCLFPLCQLVVDVLLVEQGLMVSSTFKPKSQILLSSLVPKTKRLASLELALPV